MMGTPSRLIPVFRRHQELAPLALFADGPEQQLPGQLSFGNIAQSVFGAEGLAAPIGCQEVFRFDAGGLLNHDFPAAQVDCCVSLTALSCSYRIATGAILWTASTMAYQANLPTGLMFLGISCRWNSMSAA